MVRSVNPLACEARTSVRSTVALPRGCGLKSVLPSTRYSRDRIISFSADWRRPAKSIWTWTLVLGVPASASFPAGERAVRSQAHAQSAGNRVYYLRACFKIPWGPVFAEKAAWRGATKENIPGGSSTEEQRSQAAFSAKTLRAAGLLSAACVGSALTARCGDGLPKANESGAQRKRSLREMLSPASPPWPQPKSLAAGPHAILKQALRVSLGFLSIYPFGTFCRLRASARMAFRSKFNWAVCSSRALRTCSTISASKKRVYRHSTAS